MTIFEWFNRASVLVAVIIFSCMFDASFAFAQVATTTVTANGQVSNIDPHNSADVEMAVQQYFADAPIMVAVANCESGFRQYDSNGLPLFDSNYSVVGVFQEAVDHMPQALAMGWDITTLPGNLAYANYLYQQQGTDPWLASYGCWGGLTPAQMATTTTDISTSTTVVVTTASSTTLMATTTTTVVTSFVSTPASALGQVLVLGMSGSNVEMIQKMLNAAGFQLASSGPGSPGNETTLFGALTRAGVRRFQCAKGIVCSGDEATTGYGAVDARTYNALLVAQPTTPEVSSTSVPVSTAASTIGTTSSLNDKTAQISQLESQIVQLTNQLDSLNQQLNLLTK